MPDSADFATSIYFCLSVTVVLAIVGSIPMFTSSIDCLVASFKIGHNCHNFISQVGTTFGLLAFSFDFTNMGSDVRFKNKVSGMYN